MSEYAFDYRAVLLGKTAGVVVNAVLSTHRLYLPGNLRIPVGGQVREHVVFHLVAKMAAQNMKPAAPGEV